MARFLRMTAGACLLSAALTAAAEPVTTIDFTPIGGTTIADLASPGGARFDFGTGHGTGTIRLALTSGAFGVLLPIPPGYVAPLSNGNTFFDNTDIVFRLEGNNASFDFEVSLDSGVFRPGSIFVIRSLDRLGDQAQYFLPGAGLGAVYPDQLPSDDDAPLVVGAGGEYSALASPQEPGSLAVSAGRAWDIGGVGAFSGRFRQDLTLGGVGFTVAVQDVPEPATLALVLGALGMLGAAVGRARRVGPLSAPLPS